MKPKRHYDSSRDVTPKVRRPAGYPTKAQLRANAQAEARAHVDQWKTLIPQATATWRKFGAVDLARTDGNFHALAGMVQLYYHVSRQEADGQVKAFFDAHNLAAPGAAKPAVSFAPVAPPAAEVPPQVANTPVEPPEASG